MPILVSCRHSSGAQAPDNSPNYSMKLKPDAPVFKLELFVSVDVAVILEKILQSVTCKAERPRRLMRVKHSDDVDAKVTLQPQYVVVGTMEYLHSRKTSLLPSFIHFWHAPV